MAWRLCRPTDIPRNEWLARLDAVPNASPYLLPEWSQFWADVWPGARAEVYDDGRCLIPAVQRRRYTLGWCFAQPYGTDCVIGDQSSIEWQSLLNLMSQSRTVEIAISADVPTTLSGWRRTSLTQGNWVIKTAGKSFAELSEGFSGTNRRNTATGEKLSLRVDQTTDADKLIQLWQDDKRQPRFMLNPSYAHALVNRFASVDALYWRTAWSGDRPVAGAVFLTHKNVAVMVDSIVDRESRFSGAGHFLVAQCLHALIDLGITRIDLGGVPGGSDHAGLDKYKSGWNATQETIHTTLHRRNWYAKLRRA